MGFLREYKIRRYVEEASKYIKRLYVTPPVEPDPKKEELKRRITFPAKIEERSREGIDKGIKYSLNPSMFSFDKLEDFLSPKVPKEPEGTCTKSEANEILRNFFIAGDYKGMTEELNRLLEETFTERVMYYVQKKGLRDPQVYNRGQIDRRLYSKMMSNREYKPSKDTAIAVAVGLGLTVEETGELLARAGYILSHSNKRDLVVEFFLSEGKCDMMFINEVLERLGLKTIGRSE